jgi:hypothetical protein
MPLMPRKEKKKITEDLKEIILGLANDRKKLSRK